MGISLRQVRGGVAIVSRSAEDSWAAICVLPGGILGGRVDAEFWRFEFPAALVPRARASGFRSVQTSKPRGCKTSGRFSSRPEDLCGRFENRELYPFHRH